MSNYISQGGSKLRYWLHCHFCNFMVSFGTNSKFKPIFISLMKIQMPIIFCEETWISRKIEMRLLLTLHFYVTPNHTWKSHMPLLLKLFVIFFVNLTDICGFYWPFDEDKYDEGENTEKTDNTANDAKYHVWKKYTHTRINGNTVTGGWNMAERALSNVQFKSYDHLLKLT